MGHMNLQEKIDELCLQAESLRALDDAEGERLGLGVLVDRINALRAEQSVKPAYVAWDGDPPQVSLSDIAILPADPDVAPKRKPGRPRKAE